MPNHEEHEESRREKLSRALRDPRTTAFFLNLAHGLTQPRGVGQTGMSSAVNALMSGYQGMAMAAELAHQRRLAEREAFLKERERLANIAKTTAETEKAIPSRAEEALAKAKESKARAGLVQAQAADIPQARKLEERKVGVSEQRAKSYSELTGAQIKQLQNQSEDAFNKMVLEKNKLKELERSNRAKEEIERDKVKIMEKYRDASATFMKAQAALMSGTSKVTDIDKLRYQAVQNYLRSRLPTLPFGEDPKEAVEEAMRFGDEMVRIIGGSPKPEVAPKPAESPEKTVSRSDLEAKAKKYGMSYEEAKRTVESLGYKVTE